MSYIFSFLSIIPSIIIFIIIFSILILVHEWGHFIAAIKSGVKVEEFGLGFGKKLWKKQVGEVEYSIGAIPFGGYVKMLGEEEKSNDPRSFEKAKLWKRMVITLAGIFMNLVLTTASLFVLFSIGTTPILISKADVHRADEQGLVTWSEADENGKKAILKLGKIKKSFPESVIFTFTETWRISGGILNKVVEIPREIINKGKLPVGLSGPVGIAEATHKIIPLGFWALVKLMALLSLSLAIMNLLPIPALDGGRFFFQIVELILKPFKIKLNTDIENYVHMAGFMVLMLLIVAITWNDIVNLIAHIAT
jgi:regulator of sigma E protease